MAANFNHRRPLDQPNPASSDDQSREANLSQSNEGSSSGSSRKRKGPGRTSLIWDTELHAKFLQVVEILGIDNCTPSKLHRLLDAPSLSKDRIASHLKAHRKSLKKGVEEKINPSVSRTSDGKRGSETVPNQLKSSADAGAGKKSTTSAMTEKSQKNEKAAASKITGSQSKGEPSGEAIRPPRWPTYEQLSDKERQELRDALTRTIPNRRSYSVPKLVEPYSTHNIASNLQRSSDVNNGLLEQNSTNEAILGTSRSTLMNGSSSGTFHVPNNIEPSLVGTSRSTTLMNRSSNTDTFHVPSIEPSLVGTSRSTQMKGSGSTDFHVPNKEPSLMGISRSTLMNGSSSGTFHVPNNIERPSLMGTSRSSTLMNGNSSGGTFHVPKNIEPSLGTSTVATKQLQHRITNEASSNMGMTSSWSGMNVAASGSINSSTYALGYYSRNTSTKAPASIGSTNTTTPNFPSYIGGDREAVSGGFITSTTQNFATANYGNGDRQVTPFETGTSGTSGTGYDDFVSSSYPCVQSTDWISSLPPSIPRTGHDWTHSAVLLHNINNWFRDHHVATSQLHGIHPDQGIPSTILENNSSCLSGNYYNNSRVGVPTCTNPYNFFVSANYNQEEDDEDDESANNFADNCLKDSPSVTADSDHDQQEEASVVSPAPRQEAAADRLACKQGCGVGSKLTSERRSQINPNYDDNYSILEEIESHVLDTKAPFISSTNGGISSSDPFEMMFTRGREARKKEVPNYVEEMDGYDDYFLLSSPENSSS